MHFFTLLIARGHNGGHCLTVHIAGNRRIVSNIEK